MTFRPIQPTDHERLLRSAVREFLRTALPPGYRPRLAFASAHDPDFTRALAARGWVGMTIPKKYGGAGAPYMDRYIVAEELLAAGAPIGAHWAADRQTASMILKYGTEDQRRTYLPKIASGEWYFSVGMSEPDSGSDLASVRTTARRDDAGGWIVNGTKVWTTHAHLNHFMLTLCRTSAHEDRHHGLSQMIVDLKAPGVTVRPIEFIDGSDDFNEVVLEDVHVADTNVLGDVGAGWQQATSELAYERSGPDRYLTVMAPLIEFVRRTVDRGGNARQAEAIGGIAAKLWGVRQLGLAVARSIDEGAMPSAEAALVKDLGTALEQEIVETLREVAGVELDPTSDDLFENLLAEAVATGPSFTIRGGTTEVMRSVAAKGLEGVRW
ncbi:acyl-CoA dehydrogenase family protein [Saccharopolyspora spinosa]|uniref:Alkylation response protein AidB-like acyl-CoA dehydrogenase n=1 Tax=Saccharopolyspora spinosa TaxID=60894 RepID=A0A2N3XXR0_SACSN|nr:acyl-CoA dehydrogenase family protein [Saccharopolyspora spinosa]PKW15456.1 alkylation response protein AidB-like acyl-CoA dehydrogenase [Saccharopolyspora spinosa]